VGAPGSASGTVSVACLTIDPRTGTISVRGVLPNGKRILDASAGLWCASLGFAANERIAKVAYDQMRKLGYYQTYRGHSNDPVIDLTEHLHVNQYEVPDRLAAQAAERDLTCVFPWCTRPAESCDLDHVIPYSDGGTTSSDNIATLCRRHHRLKTHHSGWGYTVLEPGCYLWSSPHGYQFLRDHTGTTDVTRDKTSHPPDE